MSSEDIIILNVGEKVFGGDMEKDRKKGIEWGVLASKLFCVAVISFLIYTFVRYALGALMPFVIAYLFSLIIEPVACFLSKRSRVPKKLCAFFSLSIVASSLRWAACSWWLLSLLCFCCRIPLLLLFFVAVE